MELDSAQELNDYREEEFDQEERSDTERESSTGKEAYVDCEGGIPEMITTLLIKTRQKIHGARLSPLEGDRYRIHAHTSRRRLRKALVSLRNVRTVTPVEPSELI